MPDVSPVPDPSFVRLFGEGADQIMCVRGDKEMTAYKRIPGVGTAATMVFHDRDAADAAWSLLDTDEGRRAIEGSLAHISTVTTMED